MMNTDYRPTNSWAFRLRAAKLGVVSVRSLAALSLTVALIALLATLATLLAPTLQAQSITEVEVPYNWSLKPDGLGTGDQFRLLFLSSTKTDATSANIADYNTFIQNRAAAGHTDIQDYSAGFRAVGCTTAVDARDNTGTNTNTDGAGVPIYWLNGNKAADNNADFYDGNWDDEANDKNESGNNGPDTSQEANWPFTGCDHDGTEAVFGTSSRALGASQVRLGRPNTPGTTDGPLGSDDVTTSSESRPMYGLSQVFEVPIPTISLVSNTHLTPAGGTTGYEAQSFETGTNAGGYTVSRIDMRLGFASGTNTTVKIRENNADNEPGDLVATLTNPGTLTDDSLNTFTAQDTITLDPSTTYWISVNEDISTSSASIFSTNFGDAETGETGWTIGDNRLSRTDETDGWNNTGSSSLLMTIKGNPRPSFTDDARLSALTLEGADGGDIPLDTIFASDDYEYEATVANRIDTVKLTAKKNDDNAMVVITNDDDDGTAGEALLDLIVGSNTLTVTVTAQDGTTTRTYKVTVERYTADTLISNTHLSPVVFARSTDILAQSFATGTNAGGYTVSQVDIALGAVSGTSTSVKIRENNGGEPGDLVATLANPGTLTENSLNTFTAPAGTPLAANTTYWITTNEGISSNRAQFTSASENDETGETGWSIGDSRLSRNSEMDSWDGIDTSLLITIKGTAIPATTLVSNTHLSQEYSTRNFLAQSFETGANPDGYTVSEVDIRFAETSGKITSVRIRKNDADNEPGNLVATLNNPGTLTSNSLNTFTAQTVITLAASTTYWLTVNEEISSYRAYVFNDSGNDQTGETGWSIGDGHLWRTNETSTVSR